MHETQQIDMGPITVDTGDDWMDFGFVIALFVILIAGLIVYHRFTRPSGG